VPPQPKRKLSKGRRDRRRSHLALTAPNLVECPTCHKLRRPHVVCPNCGSYQGEEIYAVEEKTKKTK
jgi:large subunit ribosomal protein L32